MITPRELEWAAAFIEGEGTFEFGSRATSSARCSAVQVQEWPVAKLHRLFGGKMYLRRPQKKTWQPVHVWRANGARAIGVMMTLYTLMSPWRQEQIRGALSEWRRRGVANRYRTHCRLNHALTERPGMPNARWCRNCAIASTTRAEKIRDAQKRDDLKIAGLYRAPGHPTRAEARRKRETVWVAMRRDLLWQNRHLTGRTTPVWFKTA